MSEHACPDHPEATMHGLLGDYYCTSPGCDWWFMPLSGDDDE